MANQNLNRTPIFIGGLMKSGTSLLRKLLGTHPDIFGGLETHWCSQDFKDSWQDGQGTRQEWLLKFFEVDTETANDIRAKSNSAFEFFNSFMNYVTERADKNRWVEKTPDNFRHIEEILKEWPDAKILILNRDKLDVYASWKKNNKFDIGYFIKDSKAFTEMFEKYNSHPSVQVIFYETLVNETKETLKSVCNFIDSPYIEGLENYKGDDHDFKKVLTVTGKESPTTDSLRRPIFNSSIGQFADILTEAEIKTILEQC